MSLRVRHPLSEASTLWFFDGKSPLSYERSGSVKRIILCDTSVTEPPKASDMYIVTREYLNWYSKRTNKRLKKPHKIVEPGIDAVCAVGFLDYHWEMEGGYYLDYVKTRTDQRGKGYATMLINYFYQSHPDATYVRWGKMMQPEIGKLLARFQKKYPGIRSSGHVYY